MTSTTFRLALLITVLATTALAAGPAFAQPADREGLRGEASPQDRLERLADHLELTEAQRTALQPILAEHHAAMQALHAEAKALRDDVRSGDLSREEAQAQRSAFATRIQAERAALAEAAQPILTDEQQAKLAEMQAKREHRRAERGSHRGERRSHSPGQSIVDG